VIATPCAGVAREGLLGLTPPGGGADFGISGFFSSSDAVDSLLLDRE
jgi:hypothetical protein